MNLNHLDGDDLKQAWGLMLQAMAKTVSMKSSDTMVQYGEFTDFWLDQHWTAFYLMWEAYQEARDLDE